MGDLDLVGRDFSTFGGTVGSSRSKITAAHHGKFSIDGGNKQVQPYEHGNKAH
jgi:hypothetical protein